MKKISITLSSFDGIKGCYCGVGTMAINFIKSINKISELLEDKYQIDWFILSPDYQKSALGYNEKVLNNNLDILSKNNGKIIYYDDGSDGLIAYGYIPQWNKTSKSVANIILNFYKNYDYNIVFMNETPYVDVVKYVNYDYEKENIAFIYNVHGTCLIHQRYEKIDTQKKDWEMSIDKYSKEYNNFYLGYISNYIKKHLIEDFNIKEEKLIPIINGIFLHNEKYQNKKSDISILQKYELNFNNKIIISFGRPEFYKGFHILIDSLNLLNRNDFSLVLQLPPYDNNTQNVYLDLIKEKLSNSKFNYLLLEHFEDNFISNLIKFKNTKLVVVPSLAEPFGLIPVEVRMLASETGAITLVSNKDGLVEQIEDNIDGFIGNIENLIEFSEKINFILDLEENRISQIRNYGYNKVLESYDYEKNLFKTISLILEKQGLYL